MAQHITLSALSAASRWTASWRAAMQSLNDPLVAYPYVVPRLDGVTLCQSVKLRSSGSAVRVCLSNQYGSRPIHIGAAHVAPAGTGSGHAGLGAAITFAGNTGIVIAAGTQWVSDPVELSASADSTWLISLYIERADEAATGESHRQAVNHWLRNSADFDGIADFDAALSDPLDPTRLNARFDSGDHLHLNDSGYGVMADTVVGMFQR